MKHMAIAALGLGLITLPGCLYTPEPVADAATGCTRVQMLGMDRPIWLRTDTMAGFGRVSSPTSAIHSVSLKLPPGYEATEDVPFLLLAHTDKAPSQMTCTMWYHAPSSHCQRQIPGTELTVFIDYGQGDEETIEADATHLADYVERDVICRPPPETP